MKQEKIMILLALYGLTVFVIETIELVRYLLR